MASTFILKRKLYTDPQQQSSQQQNQGMGTGTKMLLGGAALAGGLFAGKAGMLGTGLQKSINKGWAATGKMVGSQKMIDSGAKGYGDAMIKQSKAAISQKYGTSGVKKVGEDAFTKHGQKWENQIKDQYAIPEKPVTPPTT